MRPSTPRSLAKLASTRVVREDRPAVSSIPTSDQVPLET